MPIEPANSVKRVFLLGATGTIGRATARSLIRRGHEVVCFVRPRASLGKEKAEGVLDKLLPGCKVRFGEATDFKSLLSDGIRGEYFDAIISCMASRNGTSGDAWKVDYQAHVNVLEAAQKAQIRQFIQLSAICVQKPMLAFQHAKLAFESKLIESGFDYAIVRPTAYFKSLSGQIARLRRGKPFLVFGNGEMTSCKPIGNDDLADYLVDCLEQPAIHSGVLPIGGPGEAITPRQQGEYLFELLRLKPRFRRVPVRMLDVVIGALSLCGRWFPKAADKAELARIGRYYATESMLVFNPQTNRYDAAATPSTGKLTLFDFYETAIRDHAESDLGEHSVF